jgi:adenosylhomocysteine nucleosidase
MREEIDTMLRVAGMSGQKCERVGDREFYPASLYGQDVVLAFSRWGKVAAAITTTHLIDAYAVDSVWFTGVAGALDPTLSVGDIVIAEGLIQHDLDARPLFSQFEIPLSGRARLLTDPTQRTALVNAAAEFLEHEFQSTVPAHVQARFGIVSPRVVQADIATGDRFISSAADAKKLRALLPSCACVEMEGAAVAQACIESRIPFAVLRVISDSANDDAHVDFQRFVTEVAGIYLHKIMSFALTHISERACEQPR